MMCIQFLSKPGCIFALTPELKHNSNMQCLNSDLKITCCKHVCMSNENMYVGLWNKGLVSNSRRKCYTIKTICNHTFNVDGILMVSIINVFILGKYFNYTSKTKYIIEPLRMALKRFF